MAITDSRNKLGTLTIDALTTFSKQITNVKLTPSVDEDGDKVETLDGSTILPDEVTSWVLELGAIQDFDDPDGFVEFARANAGDLVPVVWQPNQVGAPSYACSVKVRAVEIGGEIAQRLPTSTTWPVDGEPTPTYAP